jgi:hypothetical protein
MAPKLQALTKHQAGETRQYIDRDHPTAGIRQKRKSKRERGIARVRTPCFWNFGTAGIRQKRQSVFASDVRERATDHCSKAKKEAPATFVADAPIGEGRLPGFR